MNKKMKTIYWNLNMPSHNNAQVSGSFEIEEDASEKDIESEVREAAFEYIDLG